MYTRALRWLVLGLPILSACQSHNTVQQAEFDNYLKDSPTAPYTRLGVALCTAPADLPFLDADVSSDGEYLGVILPDEKTPTSSVLQVTELASGKTTAVIHALRANDLAIVPMEFAWSPSGHEFWVKMAFSDSGGGDWLACDPATGQFTAAGEAELAQMAAYSSAYRPDAYYDSRDFGMPEWPYPAARTSLSGEARTWLFIKDRFYEVLLEVGIEQVHPRNQANAYVYCAGQFVRRLQLAANYTPMDELLFYEGGDLVMVGGADDPQNGYHPLKIRFPRQTFENLFVTQAGVEQRIVLITRSPENYTVYLLRTHPAYDFNLAAEEGGVPPW